MLRVLREKTGSEFYTIQREFEESVKVGRARDRSTSSGEWETRMYLVEYTGDGTDFTPSDEDIEQVRLFSPKEALERISSEDGKALFEKHITNRGDENRRE